MGTLFTFIYDGIRTDFGYPARLMRLIQERPELAINVPVSYTHLTLPTTPYV